VVNATIKLKSTCSDRSACYCI